MTEPLHIERLEVSLGDARVLHGVNLDLEAGAYGVVLGRSGAGKSTLLRAIAGLVGATGTIRIGDRVILDGQTSMAPERRGVGFLFQGLALWPHMTVAGHLRFALKGAGTPAAEHEERIHATLGPLGIEALADRRPAQLSGGERQRLALARALVTRPGLMLLDEPTSSVDPTTAGEVQDLLRHVNEQFGSTVLHVTHDQEEALGLADQVLVMDGGRILQSGSPEEVYKRPASAAVARFVGAGSLLPATLDGDGVADTPLGRVSVDPAGHEGAVWLLFRPEDLELSPVGEGVPAEVDRILYGGGAYRVRARIGEWPVDLVLAARPDAGSPLRIRVVRPPRVVDVRSGS